MLVHNNTMQFEAALDAMVLKSEGLLSYQSTSKAWLDMMKEMKTKFNKTGFCAKVIKLK